jgi:hypothetical protein
MLLLSLAFAALSLLLGISFHRKYKARVRSCTLDTARYRRIGDYYGTPILLAFRYRPEGAAAPSEVEADVDEIYHYGRDYFLKGRSPDGKRSQVFKWSRISSPQVRYDGRFLESLEALFQAVDNDNARAAA